MTSRNIVNSIIDVSHWQCELELSLLKEQGINALICKASQGLTAIDNTYKTNIQKGLSEGVMLGSYHFGINADGTKQADHFLDTIKGINGIVVLDWEESKTPMTLGQATMFVKRVHDRTGKYPILYSGTYFLNAKYVPKDSILKNCPLWIASYTNNPPSIPNGFAEYKMWQYTDGSQLILWKNSRKGKVDRSFFMGTDADLEKFWNDNSVIVA